MNTISFKFCKQTSPPPIKCPLLMKSVVMYEKVLVSFFAHKNDRKLNRRIGYKIVLDEATRGSNTVSMVNNRSIGFGFHFYILYSLKVIFVGITK